MCDSFEDFTGENIETVRIVVFQLFDIPGVDEVTIEFLQVLGDPEIIDGEQFFLAGIIVGIDIEFEVVFKEAAKGLQNAAFEVLIVFFLKELSQGEGSHANADLFLGVARQVGGQSVVFKVIGNEDGVPRGLEEFCPGQEILVIDFTGCHQVIHGDFHEFENFLFLHSFFFCKALARGPKNVRIGMADRPEAPAFNKDVLLIKRLGRLDDLSVGPEHGGIAQSLLDQLQAHQTVVDVPEFNSREFDHIDFDSFGAQVIEQRFDQLFRVMEEEAGSIDEVDADHAEGFLLGLIFMIKHTDMNDNLAGFIAGVGLELDPHPAMAFSAAPVTGRPHRIGEGKKSGPVSPDFGQAFLVQIHLVVQHILESFPADVTFAGAIDGVTDLHVVGGNAFGDRSGGPAGLEKPAHDFLARTDFREGAVAFLVEVNQKGLASGGEFFALGGAGVAVGIVHVAQVYKGFHDECEVTNWWQYKNALGIDEPHWKRKLPRLMAQINDHYLKLKAGYLFPEIARRVNAFCEANPDGARKLIKCGIGDVTEPLPEAAREAIHKAVDELGSRETFRGYGPEQGYEFLRQAIAKNDYQSLGVKVAADEIFVSDGSKCDTGNILDIFGSGNRIAITDPVYPVYVDTNVMAGHTGPADESGAYGGLVYLPCTEDNDFVPALPEERVDLIYLCYPNNPTGAVATKEQLESWVGYARRHGSILLYDAAYGAFIQDAVLPRSIYEIDGARECAIEFRSFSKNGGFTGTRCAFTVIPKELKGKAADGSDVAIHSLWSRRHSTKFNGVSYPIQRGAEALYSEEGKAQVSALIEHYMGNAVILRKAAGQCGLRCFGGEHAPYIWVKCPEGKSSWDVFDTFLKEANVVVTPGAGFGSAGEGYFRISAFNSRENVEEVARRIGSLSW